MSQSRFQLEPVSPHSRLTSTMEIPGRVTPQAIAQGTGLELGPTGNASQNWYFLVSQALANALMFKFNIYAVCHLDKLNYL